ncbi:MAG TPA: AMP-binding protein [Geminicoccaceae bacterium]|nr:AMP-binding protein [Geminicoccaceae bacterium]
MNQIDRSHFDPLETREPAQRDAELLAALPGLLRHAQESAPALALHLAGIGPDGVTSFAALAALPVLRKEELRRLQEADPPFGGLLATPLGRLAKVFVSPGPILDPEGTRPDYWRFARALHAAGFRQGDLIHNSFAYHLTPAGSIIESAARALGCPVFPAGTGQTEQQLRAIERLRPKAYTGTPSFLKTLLERGREDGVDLSCLTKAVVSGEAFPRALAEELRADAGIDAYQSYGTADLGLVAYETPAREGLVVDEGVLVEIVRPGSGDPVPAGEVGELIVTAFNPDYPLVRFATGDLSAILPGQSPCGRTNRRLRGWLGRADQTTKVKGMFVYPSQVADVARRHPEIGRARLVVEREDSRDRMTLHCEVAAPAEGLEAAIAESLRTATSLRGAVRLVAAGSLANDGKVIDDRRAPG